MNYKSYVEYNVRIQESNNNRIKSWHKEYMIKKKESIMKTKIEVQFQERNIDVKDTEKLVKENLKAAGVKMNTIANLDIYYQPEEGDIYYVATTKDGKELSNEEALKIEE